MQSYLCSHCGMTLMIPDYSRCPVCNLNLLDKTSEFSKKHLLRCASKYNPYIYSKRKRGRPSRDDMWVDHGLDVENDK